MNLARTTAVAGLLVIAAAVTSCGGASSSSSAGDGGAAAAPTDASQSDFCRTFTRLGTGATPHEAADRLLAVGTPSGISASARDGFVLLASHLSALPDDSQGADLESVANDLRGSDQGDLVAFITYYAAECSPVPRM